MAVEGLTGGCGRTDWWRGRAAWWRGRAAWWHVRAAWWRGRAAWWLWSDFLVALEWLCSGCPVAL